MRAYKVCRVESMNVTGFVCIVDILSLIRFEMLSDYLFVCRGAKGPAAGKTKEAKMKAATAKKGIKKKVSLAIYAVVHWHATLHCTWYSAFPGEWHHTKISPSI